MGIIKQAGDLVYTFRFLNLLVTPFNKTKAYEYGIIDGNGKRIKDFDLSKIENRKAFNDYYTPFHRLVFNIKRLMSKAPGGDTRLASYAAALYLIKEDFSISERKILKGIEKLGLDPTDILAEDNQWFVTENNMLSPGTYRLKYERSVCGPLYAMTNKKDKIKVSEDCYPIASFLGVNIYEAVHANTGKRIYITSHEITR